MADDRLIPVAFCWIRNARCNRLERENDSTMTPNLLQHTDEYVNNSEKCLSFNFAHVHYSVMIT